MPGGLDRDGPGPARRSDSLGRQLGDQARLGQLLSQVEDTEDEGIEGAERGIESITAGLGWTKVAETVVVSGKPSKADLESCWELGATVAAQLIG